MVKETPKMQIQQATLKDLEDLALLFDAYRVFYNKNSDLKGATNFLKSRIENQESTIFIARNEAAKALGFVQLYPLFSSTRMKKLWLLNDLFVAEQFRGLGVSVALINKAKALVKSTNACGLTLETGKDNIIGNNLYPKTGFKLNKDYSFYFWDV